MVFGSKFQVIFVRSPFFILKRAKIVQINKKNQLFLCKHFTTDDLGLNMRPSKRIAGRARFNAPDLKSDVRSNVPGVRIPRYPPHSKGLTIVSPFFYSSK
jgi:hypothetical protein